jgi:hypothetical protein
MMSIMGTQDLLDQDVAEAFGLICPLQQFMPQGCLVAGPFRKHLTSKIYDQHGSMARLPSVWRSRIDGSDLLKLVSRGLKVLVLNCSSAMLKAVACGIEPGKAHRCFRLPSVAIGGQV